MVQGPASVISAAARAAPVTSGAEAASLAERIVARLAALADLPVDAEVRAISPLPRRAGDASAESWEVTLALPAPPGSAAAAADSVALRREERFVLRGDARRPLPGTLDRDEEHAVVLAAVAAGVKTPSPCWPLRGLTRAGARSYFRPFVAGEARGRVVLTDPDLADARAHLPHELGQQLAFIHAIVPSSPGAPTSFPGVQASEPGCDAAAASLAWLRGVLDSLASPRPAVELAFDWLVRMRPPPGPVVLVHGDFRLGNFLVAPGGLAAILGWKCAHWGAPEEDLAWLCLRAFRFGEVTRPVGGFGQRAALHEAYAQASGHVVDPQRVHWWEVLGNCRSAVGCALHAERYASRGAGGAGSEGDDARGVRDVELASVGRRAAEREWEALRLIDFGVAGKGTSEAPGRAMAEAPASVRLRAGG